MSFEFSILNFEFSIPNYWRSTDGVCHRQQRMMSFGCGRQASGMEHQATCRVLSTEE